MPDENAMKPGPLSTSPETTPCETPQTREEIAKEYGLVNELGEWYWDVPIFDKHFAEQKLINKFLDMAALRSSGMASCELCHGSKILREEIKTELTSGMGQEPPK